MSNGAVKNKTYKMQIPIEVGGQRYETVVLKPLKTKHIMKLKVNATGEREIKEMVEILSNSSGIPIAIIEEFDARDTFELIGEVSHFLLPVEDLGES